MHLREASASSEPVDEQTAVFDVRDLSVFYGDFRAVRNVNLVDPPPRDHRVHRPVRLRQDHGAAVLQPHERPGRPRPGSTGRSCYHGVDLYDPEVDPVEVRRRIGMVFQKPNPFPKSIYDNVAYGPTHRGQEARASMDDIVEKSLRQAALWDEVKDRLQDSRPWGCRAGSSSASASPAPSPSSPR